ncbi:MAG: PorV/PorQ family protein [Bacteroidota bacterium]
MTKAFTVRILALLFALAIVALPASGQTVVKYGADFLAGGIGGRALGMGGAHVALAADASAGYWNPAGLAMARSPEVAYMHAERFAGMVSFDYGGAVFPVSDESSIGVSFFRSGVNDIKNTLDAWDEERDRPRPNPSAYITTFSAADYAFFVSYARTISDGLSAGVTGKLIRRSIGEFAEAWGYSFDVGAQMRNGPFFLGASIQDVSTMLQTWSIDQDALGPISDVFDEAMPAGGTELMLPVARLGSGYEILAGQHTVTLALDLDVAFDGAQNHAFSIGDVSVHPRAGGEYAFRDVLAFRAGLMRIGSVRGSGLDVVPTVGAGLRLSRLSIDYGFGDFAGMPSELGFSHRISASLLLGNRGANQEG